jgi:hypothetical protein
MSINGDVVKWNLESQHERPPRAKVEEGLKKGSGAENPERE